MRVKEEINREGRLLTTTDPGPLWRRLLEEVRHPLEQRSLGSLKSRASLLAQPPSLSWGIWRGSLEELEAFDDSELPVNTTIELRGQALVAVSDISSCSTPQRCGLWSNSAYPPGSTSSPIRGWESRVERSSIRTLIR
jgi:hypothetical protein